MRKNWTLCHSISLICNFVKEDCAIIVCDTLIKSFCFDKIHGIVIYENVFLKELSFYFISTSLYKSLF